MDNKKPRFTSPPIHHKSLRGKTVDIAQFTAQHGDTVAIGNASMNARGDKVDRFGKVIKPRETISQEYNTSNLKAVKVSVKNIMGEVLSPAEAVKGRIEQTGEPLPKPAVLSSPSSSRSNVQQPPAVPSPPSSPRRKIEDSEN